MKITKEKPMINLDTKGQLAQVAPPHPRATKSRSRRITFSISMSKVFAAVTVLAIGLQCGSAIAQSDAEIRTKLKEMSDKIQAHTHNRTSSVLGQLPTPKELAATQVNFREIYMGKPARRLSPAEIALVEKEYGHVTFFMPPRSGRATFSVGNTGIHAKETIGERALKVMAVDDGAPAAGKLQVEDWIVGAFGHLFPLGDDPRIPMGYALAETKTQRKRGILILDVIRQGRWQQISIEVRVDGEYSPTWPYNCAKSKKIAEETVDYLVDKGTAENWWGTLFLMGAGVTRE